MNSEPGIPDHFTFDRIEVPDSFASGIIDRIEAEKKGGFSSFPTITKVLFVSLTLLIYSSIGAFMGMQGHKNYLSHIPDSKKKAILDLRKTHHLDPVSSFDNILRPFEPIK